MSEVKWIKIKRDIFDNRKIKQIEVMPDGDTIIVIWLKLLCLAADINDSGMVYLTRDVPYTDNMLASEFKRPQTTVNLALRTFEEFGMIEMVDSIWRVSNWDKYQSGLEKLKDEDNRLEKKREYDRERMRKKRAEQKGIEAQKNECVVEKSYNGRTTSYDTTSYSISNSKELDDIDINNNNTFNDSKVLDKSNKDNTKKYKESINSIIDYLNNRAGTNYKPTTKKTQTLIIARMKEGNTVDDFKTVIDKKCNEWLGTEHEKYLRPETLFGTKFEGYLNQHIIAQKPKGEKQIDWDNV